MLERNLQKALGLTTACENAHECETKLGFLLNPAHFKNFGIESVSCHWIVCPICGKQTSQSCRDPISTRCKSCPCWFGLPFVSWQLSILCMSWSTVHLCWIHWILSEMDQSRRSSVDCSAAFKRIPPFREHTMSTTRSQLWKMVGYVVLDLNIVDISIYTCRQACDWPARDHRIHFLRSSLLQAYVNSTLCVFITVLQGLAELLMLRAMFMTFIKPKNASSEPKNTFHAQKVLLSYLVHSTDTTLATPYVITDTNSKMDTLDPMQQILHLSVFHGFVSAEVRSYHTVGNCIDLWNSFKFVVTNHSDVPRKICFCNIMHLCLENASFFFKIKRASAIVLGVCYGECSLVL